MMARIRGSFQGDGHALAGGAGHPNSAAQGIEASLHHIHVHPAPRDTGDRPGGGGARLEDEGEQAGSADRLIRREQPLFLGPGTDRCGIEPPPIIFDRHQHLRPGVDGPQMHLLLFRLAQAPPFLWCFQPMVDSIAQQVHKRIVQGVDDRFVEFCLLAGKGELDRLAEIAPEIMDQTAEAPEQGADPCRYAFPSAFLFFQSTHVFPPDTGSNLR
ncbi:MAG: hypothetical protein FD153_487 [Rhodospirillaceae bacterium]|nr:MAG: hypothetical protein FD153_487 [Rhodospirillaceae bacterium]